MASRTEIGTVPDEGTVPANGIELFYTAIGSGAPLIAVHGGPGLGHSYLRPGMDVLAERFRLVYYDQRGSGRSDLGDPDRVTLAGGVEDLLALIDGLGIERANLIGHSFGAALAALLASRHPDRVRSVVLANIGPAPFDADQAAVFWGELDRRRTAEDLAEWERIQRSEGFASGDPAALEEHVRMMHLPFFNARALAATVSYGFTGITAANLPLAWERTFRDVDPPAAMEGLERIEAATLVIHGELEPIPETFTRRLADQIPGARYAFLDGANHFAFIEDPEPFFAAVTGFLAEEAS